MCNSYGICVSTSTVLKRRKQLVRKNKQEKEFHFFGPKKEASDKVNEEIQNHALHKIDASDASNIEGVPLYSVSGKHRDVVIASYPSLRERKVSSDQLQDGPSSTVESFTIPYRIYHPISKMLCHAVPHIHIPQPLHQHSSVCDYEVLGDNFDIMINPTVMTKDCQRKSLHWFLIIAKKKLITFPELPDDGAKAEILELPTSEWLPSKDDQKSLETDLDFHTAKILVKYLDFLIPYKGSLPKYIHHPYIRETSQKSVIINSDLVDASENSSEGMIKINNKIHEDFVPKNNKGECVQKIVFGGDVLTNERAFSAQLNVRNGHTRFTQTAGVIHRPEGLHRQMNFVLVTYSAIIRHAFFSSLWCAFILKYCVQESNT